MSKFNNDNNILNQFSVIKSLVNRKEYSLSEKQMKAIHARFKNMYHHRR